MGLMLAEALKLAAWTAVAVGSNAALLALWVVARCAGRRRSL